MVSVITCTIKQECMDNIFKNYEQQEVDEKELIIILNQDDMDIKEWQKRAKKSRNVSVYQFPFEVSVGKCKNFAIEKAKYDIIAKFDDDDYYGPQYLKEILAAFNRTNADIVGKQSVYAYMEKYHAIMIRDPGNENRFTRNVRDSTLVFKKEIINKVPFPDKNQHGDWEFQKACIKKGYKIYSTSKQNFTYIRRDKKHHTWKVSDRDFMKKCKFHSYTDDYISIANKK